MTSQPNPDAETETHPAGQAVLRSSWLRRHSRLSIALAAVIAILLLVIVPPFISLEHYRKHIAELISTSLGRPAHIGSVELRLLPRPGFVLNGLTVDEDPAYGSEPMVYADKVVASIRLLSLWRGRLALDRISVDEASLNLVRTPAGRWNVDSLLRTAGPGTTADSTSSAAKRLPYLEATNSRINFKNGAEKYPFSLTATDASLQQEDGAWHVSLRGQPMRTDIPVNQADTGIVRIDAQIHPAAELGQMPIHIDADWREAQLGQLSRFLLGSDADWRGDLTGNIQVNGTVDAAKVTARLRATEVHRAEFSPAGALDFDANCAFLYRNPQRSLENIKCDSPIGSGRARLTGNLAGNQPADSTHLTLELDRVPAQAPLDALRTMRGNLDEGLTAEGSLSGKMTYAPQPDNPTDHHERGHSTSPLDGSFTADSIKLSGEGISDPILASKFVIEPDAQASGTPLALTASASIPAGAPATLTIAARLTAPGFDATLRGPATLARLRDLARAAGITQAGALSQLTADPAALDLRVTGPWTAPFESAESSALAGAPEANETSKQITGTVSLRNAEWKPEFLARLVTIPAATLRFENGEAHWDAVSFTYGAKTDAAPSPASSSPDSSSPISSSPASSSPISSGPIKGTASAAVPLRCELAQSCTVHFDLRFAALDAGNLEDSLLGPRQPGTLLSSLLDRFRSTPAPKWPPLEGTIEAAVFTAGPFRFTDARAAATVLPSGAKITGFEAQLAGGRIRGTGAITAPSSADSQNKSAQPSYTLEAEFTGINPAQAGELAGGQTGVIRARGGSLSGRFKLSLSGFTAADLAASANGSAKFDWPHGEISSDEPIRFDRFAGEAKIADGKLTLGQNQLSRGAKAVQAEGELNFAGEPKFTLTAPKR